MASDSNSSPDSPPPSQWPVSLEYLLNSSTGKNLFLDYLRNEDEGLSVPMLFLLAVEGLHGVAEESDEDQMMFSSINLIYEELMPSVACLSQQATESIRRKIAFPTIGIYDEAVDEVREYLSQNLYPNFLKSEFYLAAINHEYGGMGASAPDPGLPKRGDSHQLPSGSKELLFPSKPGTSSSFPLNDLQTVHEEEVLSLSLKRTKPFELTEKILLSTQWERAKKGTGNGPQNPYHAQYSSYNPVSRLDSEIQSVSSGRTDDSAGQSRRWERPGNVIHKKDELPPVALHIPLREEYTVYTMAEKDPAEYARILIQRLEVVARMSPEKRLLDIHLRLHPVNHDRAVQNVFSSAVDNKMLESSLKKLGESTAPAPSGGGGGGCFGGEHGRVQTEDLELEPQSILDQHCSIVFKEPTTQKVYRSPRNETVSGDSRKAREGHGHGPTAPPPHPMTTAIIKGKSMQTLDSGIGGGREHRYKVRPPLPTPRWTNEQFVDSGMSDAGRSSVRDGGHSSFERPKFGDGQSRRVPPIPHRRHSPPNEETVGVLVHYDKEDSTPFIIKIPKDKLTLGVLKSKVPKKGSWKYLFKLVDADDPNKLIKYELKRDEEILPMFREDHVVVILKPIAQPPEMLSNVV